MVGLFSLALGSEPVGACSPGPPPKVLPAPRGKAILRVETLDTAHFPATARIRVLEVKRGRYRRDQILRVQLSPCCMCLPNSIAKGSKGTMYFNPPWHGEPIQFSGFWEDIRRNWESRRRSIEQAELKARPPRKVVSRPAIPRGNPAQWVTFNDYPPRALRDGRSGKVIYRLDVGPDGRVARCEITRSSGFRDLDEITCRAATRRARFETATDRNGEPTTSSYSYVARWAIPQ